MSEYKMGQTFRIKDNCPEFAMRGKVGTLVAFSGEYRGTLGLDFKERIRNYTWDLEGTCPKQTGRFMRMQDCTLLIGDWDE